MSRPTREELVYAIGTHAAAASNLLLNLHDNNKPRLSTNGAGLQTNREIVELANANAAAAQALFRALQCTPEDES